MGEQWPTLGQAHHNRKANGGKNVFEHSKDEQVDKTKPAMRWGRLVKRYVTPANKLQVILEKLDNKLDHMGRTLFECTSVLEVSKDGQGDGSF